MARVALAPERDRRARSELLLFARPVDVIRGQQAQVVTFHVGQDAVDLTRVAARVESPPSKFARGWVDAVGQANVGGDELNGLRCIEPGDQVP
ncbi:hypothetical protein [Cryobacterium sp. Hz9]|uniref:hypothetical protein n=1 Tax=Cryobacterium sp. Hz9 TaxID=1259167 RepID=UPI00106C07EB|nr:hypothetical protein [Cryobacterium sp. Hz9]TFB69191.1 hypothetical protein E3N85_04050 [Cryobacterium sp. Hz9]